MDRTGHSKPHCLQVKYSNVIVMSVTSGGPVARQFGHVPNGASVGGVGVFGVDMELTPGPKRSERCWGTDELSSQVEAVGVSGTISASLPRHVVAERIHRLRQEASRGALRATPARFGACWSLVGSCMVFGPPEHAVGLTSNWHRRVRAAPEAAGITVIVVALRISAAPRIAPARQPLQRSPV